MSQTKELITSFRFRQDTLANWNLANPILKDGEFILIKDTAEYKVGNGVSKFSELPVRGLPAVQDKGQSILNVMSQKAVTDELNRLDGVDTAQTSEINSVKSGKVDKSSILSTFPTVEPTDHTTLVSAKEAYKKVKELSDKNTQIEQDVNIVRGGVQGVKFDYNKGNKLIFPAGYLKGKSLCWWSNLDSTKTEFGYQSNSVLLLGEPIFGHNSKRIGLGVTEPSSSNTFYDPYLIKAVQNNKYKFFCLTFGDVAELYINGVRCANKNNDNIQLSLTKELVFCVASALHNASIVECYQDITNIRTFNTALTQQQIDFLYNQGRCDEVILGSEFRNTDIAVYDSFKKGELNGDYYDYISNEKNTEISIPIKSNTLYKVSYDAKAKDGFTFRPRIATDGAGNGYVGDTQYLSEGLSSNVIYTNRSATKLYILNPSISDGFSLKSLSIQAISVLNEYLPNYITQTKWIDNGVSKQDILYTAPTFTYIRPYKQHLFGSGAPSIIPDAAFTEYGDVDSDGIWKAKPKPNTRQFAVSDWKQINN